MHFALPFVLPLALIVDCASYGNMTNINWTRLGINMIYRVGILSLGMIVWQRLIEKYGITKISPFSILQIVFGVSSGIFIFGDVITPKIALGIFIVTSGVVISVLSKKAAMEKLKKKEEAELYPLPLSEY